MLCTRSHNINRLFFANLGPAQASESCGKYAVAYVGSTAPQPSPPPMKAEPKRPKAQWEQDKIETAELKYAKQYLKFGIVPPYFDTEQGLFVILLNLLFNSFLSLSYPMYFV